MEQLFTDLIKILNYPLFKIGDSVFTLISLSDLLVIGIVIYILAKVTQFIARRWLLERLGVEDVGSKEAIAKLLAYIVAIIGSIR
jgi:small-conductance mechanosensitive channel